MANLNAVTRNRTHTTNRSGHDAYCMDSKTELVSRVASCLVAEPKAYGDTTDELVELAREVACDNPGFVARLAVYARRVLNLRAVSHLLVVALADSHGAQGTGLVRMSARGIVRRGDDVTGVIATWSALHPDTHLAPGIRKGLRDAMESFGPEDATRYLGRDREMKMRDALRICHPHVTDPELRATFDAVVAGTARRPETWETELAARGNTAETWRDLLARNRVPYMARLRNLRNMLDAGITPELVADGLADAHAIERSGILPFRIYIAWRELAGASLEYHGSWWDNTPDDHYELTCSRTVPAPVARALNEALRASAANLPKLPGRTAVIVDGSGSMTYALSERGTATVLETAAVLAAEAALASDNVAVATFGSTGRVVALSDPSSPMATIREVLSATDGGVTDLSAGIRALRESGFDPDRVIVLSDGEINSGDNRTLTRLAGEWSRELGHTIQTIGWDLAGYGTTQVTGPDAMVLCGFSDSALRFVADADAGFDAMVDEVARVKLPPRGAALRTPIEYEG